MTAILEAHKPGDKVKVRVESRGGRKDLEITLGAAPQVEMKPYELAGKELTPQMAAFREAWLGNKARAAAAQAREVLPGVQADLGVRI